MTVRRSHLFSRASSARFRLFFLVLALLLVGVGCSGLPLEASWASVSLYGDTNQIMFAYANQVSLIDPIDGSPSELRDSDGDVRLDDQGNARTWRVQVEGGTATTFYTRPVQADAETLLLTAHEHRILEVDAASARILNGEGTDIAKRVVASPVLNGNLLYVPFSDTTLAALDKDTLDPVWTLSTERGVWASPLLLEAEGLLVVPSMDHFLYAVNPETGAEIWRLDLGGAVASTPVFANGYLYVGSFGRKLFKISLNGEIMYEFATKEWLWGPPAVLENQIYVADLGGYVYALTDTGQSFTELWSRQVAQRGIRPTPLVLEDTLVVGSRDRFVYWISRETGEEQVKREMRGEVLADLLLLDPSQLPSLSEPMVVVSTLAREELLVAFTLDDGERRWVYGQ